MSYRVNAFYSDLDRARIAAEDVRAAGIPAGLIVVAAGLSEGSGRVEVAARSFDEAINVQAFLQEDGANDVGIREIAESEKVDIVAISTVTIPGIPLAER